MKLVVSPAREITKKMRRYSSLGGNVVWELRRDEIIRMAFRLGRQTTGGGIVYWMMRRTCHGGGSGGDRSAGSSPDSEIEQLEMVMQWGEYLRRKPRIGVLLYQIPRGEDRESRREINKL